MKGGLTRLPRSLRWSGHETDNWPRVGYTCRKCGDTQLVAVGERITACPAHGNTRVRAGSR